jgi:predicted amidohydrolase
MSRQVSSSTDRVYGLQRVTRIWLLFIEPDTALASKLGDALKLPLLVHIGESWTKDTEPVHVGDVLKYLRAGDIVTHMFTVHPGGLLDSNGRLWPQVREGHAVQLFKSYRKDVPDGGQKRDFVYVRDAADVIRLAESEGLFGHAEAVRVRLNRSA